MAEVVRVDYEALAKIADRFGREAEAIEEMLQKVRGSMTPLQNGGWVGRGSEAFFAEMEGEILPAVRRLADALGQANTVSGQIGELMQGAEEEACSPFRAGDSGGAAAGMAAGHASGGTAGTGYDAGAAGSAAGGNMYVPQDWLNNVRGFARGGRAANDWGIPQNWLDGVAGAMGIGGGGNYGIPQDWLSGVTDALGGSGVSDGGAATGGAAGGAGSAGGAG
ncbi:MAG TPA: WXG100 family type VII secretion target, partial [Anaerolineae bacterium]|nr:WXG100 family type VII secretion target [Anaerolineae bacterium]